MHMDIASVCTAAAALLWWAILLLPWRPWSQRPFLDAASNLHLDPLDDITVLIPARNEAAVIGRTLRALHAQDDGLRVVLVDDQSTDCTAQAAREILAGKLIVVPGAPLPPGWSGKLWALEQGRRYVETPLTLLLDADIELAPDTVRTLRDKLRAEQLHFVSLMAAPRMHGFWEKLLLPAFVYFFKLLYPFHLANSGSSRLAAAAGGCILVETRLLDEIGGFAALKDALIDDCTLAQRIKARGGRTWIGLTHSARSLRACEGLEPIWNMVARTAYTQLHYSPWLLGLCSAIMALAFWTPATAIWHSDPLVKTTAAAALAAMLTSYMPILRFYNRSPLWATLMPLIGTLYLAMTWSSALRYWRGERARWKDRCYGNLAVCVFVATAAIMAPAHAARAANPLETVEDFQNTLIEVMKKAEALGYEGRRQKLEPAVEASHDLPAIAQIAAGRYWKDLNEQDRQRLVDTFSRLSIATYAYRFDSYAGEAFNSVGQEQLANGDALVQSTLTKANGEKVRFDYVLHRADSGWRIVNIVVDGVSDLALKRAEYTSIIRREGIDALLAKLREKTAQYSAGGG